MNQFDFFQSIDLISLKNDVNAWLQQWNGKIDVISWDFQIGKGIYTMTIFFNRTQQPEKVGFSLSNENEI